MVCVECRLVSDCGGEFDVCGLCVCVFECVVCVLVVGAICVVRVVMNLVLCCWPFVVGLGCGVSVRRCVCVLLVEWWLFVGWLLVDNWLVVGWVVIGCRWLVSVVEVGWWLLLLLDVDGKCTLLWFVLLSTLLPGCCCPCM